MVNHVSAKPDTLRESNSTGFGIRNYIPEGHRECVIVDMRLPDASGFEFQNSLAEANVALPLIFITGDGNDAMAAKAKKAGAIAFLRKPIGYDALLHAINTALAPQN